MADEIKYEVKCLKCGAVHLLTPDENEEIKISLVVDPNVEPPEPPKSSEPEKKTIADYLFKAQPKSVKGGE